MSNRCIYWLKSTRFRKNIIILLSFVKKTLTALLSPLNDAAVFAHSHICRSSLLRIDRFRSAFGWVSTCSYPARLTAAPVRSESVAEQTALVSSSGHFRKRPCGCDRIEHDLFLFNTFFATRLSTGATEQYLKPLHTTLLRTKIDATLPHWEQLTFR